MPDVSHYQTETVDGLLQIMVVSSRPSPRTMLHAEPDRWRTVATLALNCLWTEDLLRKCRLVVVSLITIVMIVIIAVMGRRGGMIIIIFLTVRRSICVDS